MPKPSNATRTFNYALKTNKAFERYTIICSLYVALWCLVSPLIMLTGLLLLTPFCNCFVTVSDFCWNFWGTVGELLANFWRALGNCWGTFGELLGTFFGTVFDTFLELIKHIKTQLLLLFWRY